MLVFSDMDDYKLRGANVDREYARLLAERKKHKEKSIPPASVAPTVPKPEPKPSIVVSPELLGKTVKHKQFGLGIITDICNTVIVVDFQSVGMKKMKYELCVNNGMLQCMKTVKVVAAVICDVVDGKKRIFATAKGYGEFKGQWEFPGGKIEPGEFPQQALKREIREELASEIEVGDLIGTIEYDYPTFHLSMDCFWCKIIRGELKLLEAEAARWLSKDELYDLQWLPADLSILKVIEAHL